MQPTKVQYKFRVDLHRFLETASSYALDFCEPAAFAYSYFETLEQEKAYSVLRIKTGPQGASLDLKTRLAETGEWRHFEAVIADADQMESLLHALGNKKIHTFNKSRRTFENELVRFDLDTTEELGTFLEVKFDLSDKIEVETFLQSLGVDVADRDQRSVLEIFLSSS